MPPAAAHTLHVSVAAKAAKGDGTASRPFATLEEARDAIRILKKRGPLPPGGLEVVLEAGVHARRASFDLTAEDSGTLESPVVFRAAPGASGRARLMGGHVLRNWQHLTDPAVAARFGPRSEKGVDIRDSLLQVDLRESGVLETAGLRSRGYARPNVVSHAELFVGGEPMTLARWPDMEKGEQRHSRIAGLPGSEDAGTLGKLEAGFLIDAEARKRLARWKTFDDVWVHGFWAYDWANTYEAIDAIDLERGLVKTRPPHGIYGFRPGQRIFFLNVLEELDQPWEWYLDRGRGLLIFWPPESVTLEALNRPDGPEAVLSMLGEPLLRLRDVSHVRIEGLSLECARGHGVTITGGSGCRLSGCAIRNTGNDAVRIEGGSDHRVESCDVENQGDGGVIVSGGNRATLEPCRHEVRNCRMRRQARWSKCYHPAVSLSGVGVRVANNLIEDHPHCAILFYGNEHLIELNEIRHVCRQSGDVGAIYTGRDWSMRGNVIRHNYLHHIEGPQPEGVRGVYLDDCASGTQVLGNIFKKVPVAVFIGGGRDNLVDGNIFVDCRLAVDIDGRGATEEKVWRDMVNITMRESLQAMKPDDEPYASRYPELATLRAHLERGKGVPPEGNEIVRNLCVGGDWLKIHFGAEPYAKEGPDNRVVPASQLGSLFVKPDPESPPDFKLAEDASSQEGASTIPLERIGVQPDGAVNRPRSGSGTGR